MSEKERFIKALAANEDDTSTRMIYADWLDQQGEHEEADRQRKWPDAKAWITRFCRENNPPGSEDYSGESDLSYQDLIENGHAVLENGDAPWMEPDSEYRWDFSCGANDDMAWALANHSVEFWSNWSIMTGIPVAPSLPAKCRYTCAC